MGDGVVECYGCYFLIILLRRKFFDFTGAEFF